MADHNVLDLLAENLDHPASSLQLLRIMEDGGLMHLEEPLKPDLRFRDIRGVTGDLAEDVPSLRVLCRVIETGWVKDPRLELVALKVNNQFIYCFHLFILSFKSIYGYI